MHKQVGYLFLGLVLAAGVLQPQFFGVAEAAPDAPRAIIAEGGDTSSSMRIWWVNPGNTNLDYANIYVSERPLEYFGVLGTRGDLLPGQAGSTVITNLTFSDWFYVYVTVVDTDGNESTPTTTVKTKLSVSADLTSPDQPTSITISTVDHNRIQLAWTNPGNNDFYRAAVYRSEVSAVALTEANRLGYVVDLPDTRQTFTDANLTPETTYYYRVVPEDTKGNANPSSVISATTNAAPPVVIVEPEDNSNTETPTEPEAGDSDAVVPSVMPNPDLFDYRAEWVAQSGIINATNTAHVVTASPGETVTLELTLKNVGSAWWYFDSPDNAHEVKIGTWNGADRASIFQATSWLSSNRAAQLAGVIPTGQTFTFSFDITIPSNQASGSYKEYFRPVAEYVEWFGPTGIFWEIQVN